MNDRTLPPSPRNLRWQERADECLICRAPITFSGLALCGVCGAWMVEMDQTEGPTAEFHLRALRRVDYFVIRIQGGHS